DQDATIALAHNYLVDRRGGFVANVGDLDVLTPRCSRPNGITATDSLVRDRRDHSLAHAVGGMQAKLLALIEHIDRARVGARELYCPADDGCEHGLKVERRVHRLRDFAERAKFLDRAAQFTGALAQLLQ